MAMSLLEKFANLGPNEQARIRYQADEMVKASRGIIEHEQALDIAIRAHIRTAPLVRKAAPVSAPADQPEQWWQK